MSLEVQKQTLIEELKNNLENYVFLFDYDGTLYSHSVKGIETAYVRDKT